MTEQLEPLQQAVGIIDPDYARIYTQARIVAWQHGYACLAHGSFTRDLDLLLVPWTDRAGSATLDHVIKHIARATSTTVNGPPKDKPHGRKAWTLLLSTGPDPRWVDLSVVTSSQIAEPVAVESSTEVKLDTLLKLKPLKLLLVSPKQGLGIDHKVRQSIKGIKTIRLDDNDLMPSAVSIIRELKAYEGSPILIDMINVQRKVLFSVQTVLKDALDGKVVYKSHGGGIDVQITDGLIILVRDPSVVMDAVRGRVNAFVCDIDIAPRFYTAKALLDIKQESDEIMNDFVPPEYIHKQVARNYDETVVYLTVKDLVKRYPLLKERSWQHILKTKPNELPHIDHHGRKLIHPDDFARWLKERLNTLTKRTSV